MHLKSVILIKRPAIVMLSATMMKSNSGLFHAINAEISVLIISAAKTH